MPRMRHQIRTQRFAMFLSFLSFGLLAIPATAKTVTVECEENTISNALKTLDPQANNTVRVIGTCKDAVGIYDFAELTIAGVASGGKNAVINSLNGNVIFWIVGSHVQIKNLTVNGGSWGVESLVFAGSAETPSRTRPSTAFNSTVPTPHLMGT